MMKKAILFIFISIFSVSVFAQKNLPAGFDLTNYGVKIEPDKRLMTVLATLELAKVQTPLSLQGETFRSRLRADLQSAPDETRAKVVTFIDRHRKNFAAEYRAEHPKATDAEIEAEMISPFISMSYALSPAPDLADPVVTGDLPGKLLDVLDFAPLVREFYRRSSFPSNLPEYAKMYQQASDTSLRNSAKQMVSELLDYLHTRPQIYYQEKTKTTTQKAGSKSKKIERVETRDRERRFFIVPEMLAPTGNVNFLNIGDDYYAIVAPDTDLSVSDTRRAFLQFIFDPLVLSNAREIANFRDGIKQLLDAQRKTNPTVTPDIYLAVSRSLVAATDARQTEYEKVRIATAQARRNIELMKTEAEKKKVSAELENFKRAAADQTAVQLSQAYQSGAVLAFYFAQQLKGLEDSGFDVASSMRDMILSLDAAKEADRLAETADARRRAEAAGTTVAAVNTVTIENPVTTQLLTIQKVIEAKNYQSAQTQLKTLLDKYPSEPRIYYNIGRVASLSAENIEDSEQRKQKLIEAKVAYENVLRSATATTDRALISLSYVALARIYEFYDETEYAVKIYDAAIKVGDVSGGAFREAIAAKERLLKK